MSEDPGYLVVMVYDRVWWTLWLTVRWREIVCRPPEGATRADVKAMADSFRAEGADCRIVG